MLGSLQKDTEDSCYSALLGDSAPDGCPLVLGRLGVRSGGKDMLRGPTWLQLLAPALAIPTPSRPPLLTEGSGTRISSLTRDHCEDRPHVPTQ